MNHRKLRRLMEENAKKQKTSKGGRPKSAHKRREVVSVMCNLLEKKIIHANAKSSGRNASVFLRELGLHGRVTAKGNSLPRAVLQLIGTLNHTAANLNQLAKKRNSAGDLNALERALLNQEVRSVQGIVRDIKQHLSWPSEK